MSAIPSRRPDAPGERGTIPAARPEPALRSHRTWLDTAVIVLAVGVAICGLIGLGFLILVGVGLSHMGANK